ncbi:MAG: IS21-like element helper ATPase IstB [Patescibacteria group bacterium]|nr:IS21-like element helper ATPase IstB [Patescibacteria group bacterium]
MTNKTKINLLLDYLKYLKLTGIKEAYKDFIKQAENNSLSYLDFLLLNLEYEYQTKNSRKRIRMIKDSKLPIGKKFDSFDIKVFPIKIKQKIKGLQTGGFLDRKENILVFGQPGSGKTHLLCALAYEQIEQGRKMLFTTCSLLVQKLLIAKKNLELEKIFKKLSKYEGIIIDDIGYVGQNREEMEVLFTFLAERYERGSVMITSNLPFSKWEKIFKDPMTTAAAIDRLVHHSIIIEMQEVDSFRRLAAKKRLKEAG